MGKPVFLLVLVLCTISLVGLSFQAVHADGSTSSFSEEFNGSTVDSLAWKILEQNLNQTGYPAWGGRIDVADGSLCMSSNGSTFPFIQTLQNPFPAAGDFAVQFKMTYTTIADRGAGLMMGNGTPTMDAGPWGSDIWHNRVFTLWAADKGLDEAMIYIELFNKLVFSMDYPGFKPSSPSHIYKLAYELGVYHVYVDGLEVAQQASVIRPTTIILGSPPIPRLPLSPGEQAEWAYWGWSSFEVDYINLLQKSEISLSIGESESLQLGTKVALSGNLTSDAGEPLPSEPVAVLYSIPGVSDWYPLASAITDSSGAYSVDWIPSANGNFRLRAQWSGNDNLVGCSVEKNVSILRGLGENSFVAESNSTLTSLSFNATSQEISFTVSGVSGTFGYVRFAISKTLLPVLDDFKIYMDGKEVNFTATEEADSYVLFFEYHHSTHDVILKIPAVTTPELQSWILVPLLVGLALFAVALKKKTRALGR